MNVKNYLLFCLIVLCQLVANAQGEIQWMTWDKAVEKNKAKPGKILISIFTDGCSPCKNMEMTTFASPSVINLINQNFYAVRLNAGERKSIPFNGKRLEYKCENGKCYHELAMELTSGSLSFPSVVFLDEKLNNIGAIPDYKDPTTFGYYVEFYGKGHSKEMSFNRFLDYKKITDKKTTNHK